MAFQGFVDQFTNSPVQQAYSSYLSLNLDTTNNVQLQWPTLQAETTTPVSQVVQVVTNSAAGRTVTMPDATEVSIQQTIIFANTSANDFDVNDISGNSIITVVAGQSWFLVLTDNTTQDGTWLSTVFGGVITPADAATLVNPGYGLIAETGLIKVNEGVIAIDNVIIPIPYTLTALGRGHLHVWEEGVGSSAFNLLDASTLSNGFIFAISNQSSTSSSGSIISVTPAGGSGDTINGVTTPFFIYPQQSAYFVGDGVSKWTTIGFGRQVTGGITRVDIQMTNTPTLNYVEISSTEALASIQYFYAGAANPCTAQYPQGISNIYIIENGANAGTNPLTVNVFGSANTFTIVGGQTFSCYSDGTSLYPLDSELFLNNGTVATPSLSFSSDQTSGLYLNGQYLPTVASHGINMLQFNGTSASSPTILANPGTVTAPTIPTYSFLGATNYGMGYTSATSSLGFWTQTGTPSLALTTTQTTSNNPIFNINVTAADQTNIRGLNSAMGIGLQATSAGVPNSINFYSTGPTYNKISSLFDSSGTTTTLSLQEATAPTAIGHMSISGAAASQVLALGTTADQILMTAGTPNTISLLNNTSIAGTFLAGAISGTSLATTANGNITANGSGNITTTSGNISTTSGSISGGAITGTSLATTSNGNITANGNGNITTSIGNITTAGDISGGTVSATTTVTGGTLSLTGAAGSSRSTALQQIMPAPTAGTAAIIQSNGTTWQNVTFPVLTTGQYPAFISQAAGVVAYNTSSLTPNGDRLIKMVTTGNVPAPVVLADPVSDGTYTLQCVVTAGVPVISWV